ncbi:putative transposase/invertase (TIGR01784 family) [Paenibacillus forsythiae]|uniref:Transposase/invertase (TIGR01784 family) n=1 Tax=Paenibacillus forsythiae TaxID=365616 RepID=A0ABU3HDK9_9BACL|nr:putative transposase/invertase (TIGR01784 family) [Paenibacillus forsythiae]
MNEPTLKKAMDTLEFLSQDREARRLYEERQKFLHDEASAIEWATEKGLKEGMAKGIAEGLAEGLAEGERKKAIEIAKNLLTLGIEIAVISKASGLSELEVKSLKTVQ